MNIKSLLIGSAAALASVSGAHAADAIVAAEPEAVEYVRVCDAFGTGYFYLPGTETCLKIGGYVRVQLNVGEGASEYSDYDIFARGRLRVDAKNDTEYGPLWSRVQFRIRSSENSSLRYDDERADLEEGFIELAGFRIGKFYSWWDDDLIGETDEVSTNTNFASARYVYSTDAFTVGISADELPTTRDANVGVTGYLAAAYGPVSGNVLVGYDTDLEEVAVRGWVTAEIGPGTFELIGAYASGDNAYFAEAEWTVAADYAFKVNEKLTITPGAQYFSDYQLVKGNDAWKAGLTVDYEVVAGLAVKATVNYTDEDALDDGYTSGFLRLQRDF